MNEDKQEMRTGEHHETTDEHRGVTFTYLPGDEHQPVLLTPGPLTTSWQVRQAAMTDWGSWDRDFTALTRRVVNAVEAVAGARDMACVPLQGSGTFAVEATIRTFVPKDATLLVAINGAYGERMARIAHMAGYRVRQVKSPWNQAIDPEEIAVELKKDPTITHIGLIHCETSTGLLNPLQEIADVALHAGRKVIVDAMSTFGALDVCADHPCIEAVVATSGKCLESLPGIGLVLARHIALSAADGRSDSLSLDLADQYAHMNQTGQWRFTPPTHIVAALAQALKDYHAEGGRVARLARYEANSAVLAAGARDLGLVSYLPANLQAPIIHTFHAPDDPRWAFSRFYELVRERGFILYPGKLTREQTFRVGCIGSIDPTIMGAAVEAMGEALAEMGITSHPATGRRVATASTMG